MLNIRNISSGPYALRAIEDDDHEFLVELHNDASVLMNITNNSAVTMNEHLDWWSMIVAAKDQIRLLFEVDGKRVGIAKFYDIDTINNTCALGADIHRDLRGVGHAKHLWKLMLDLCFNDLSLHRASLFTASCNHVAKHVYDKLGFKEEGRMVEALFRNGSYHDCICMYMLKDDYEKLTR